MGLTTLWHVSRPRLLGRVQKAEGAVPGGYWRSDWAQCTVVAVDLEGNHHQEAQRPIEAWLGMVNSGSLRF